MKKVTLLWLSFLVSLSQYAQIPESEPNGTFATAHVIQQFEQVVASVGGTDADDYFMTVLPANGNLEVYIRATNAGTGSGYLYNLGYDRRKTASSYALYLG